MTNDETISKHECGALRISDFDFVSSFVFRISNFP